MQISDSNPPPIIHLAQSRQEQAMCKAHRGENVEVNRIIAREMAGVVRRFCELHGKWSRLSSNFQILNLYFGNEYSDDNVYLLLTLTDWGWSASILHWFINILSLLWNSMGFGSYNSLLYGLLGLIPWNSISWTCSKISTGFDAGALLSVMQRRSEWPLRLR